MEKFTLKPYIGTNYYEDNETDFFLRALGYNDLKYFAPLDKPRIQKIYTLHFVLSGKGTVEIYGKKFRPQKYDMFFIPPNESMCYYADEKDTWTYIWVEFSGKNAEVYAKSIISDKNSPIIKCLHPHRAHRAVFDAFSRIERGEEVGYYSALSLFFELIDTCHSATNSKESLDNQIKSYILCHFHNPNLRVEDICRDFNISHSGLCKTFKQSTGITVKDYILECRINEAKSLLKETDLSVSEIGYSCGFSDNIHFMKTFKRLVHITANEYRRSSK